MVPSIAIIGAGPAGLTLARLLQVSEPTVNVTIFEHDTSPNARTYQGGTLDLHSTTGLAALRQAGLEEEAAKHLRYEGEELTIADKNGTVIVHVTEAPKIGVYDARPEIDREKLKDLLLKSVDPDKVRWGMHLRRVDAETGMLEFDGGKVEGPFDLVVGADGAYSKVRHVLTDVRPMYSGICGFEGHIYEPKEKFPETDKFVGRGSFFTYTDGRSLMAQRMGDNSIKTGMWMAGEQSYASDMIGDGQINEAELKEKLLREFTGWVPELLQWIKESTRFRLWALLELPVGHSWEHRKGYTMIGDAAHLCTPFAGQGVNAAMKDALELNNLIVKSQKGEMGLDEAVQVFEKEMVPRNTKVQEETMRNKTYMFRNDAPMGMFAEFMETFGEEAGWPIDKGILAWIPIKKIVYGIVWMVTAFGALRRKIMRR